MIETPELEEIYTVPAPAGYSTLVRVATASLVAREIVILEPETAVMVVLV